MLNRFPTAPRFAYPAAMMIFDAIATLTGLALAWAGIQGRLTTIMADPETGRDIATGVGNSLAIGAGICVIMAVVT